jgi:hypothetical protein
VATREGVAARGGVGAFGGVAARGGVGAFGGVGTRGALHALGRRASGVSSSSSSSSSIKPAMTLHHFWLPSSSSIIKGPPCLGGQSTSSSRMAPLRRGASQLLFSNTGFPRIHASRPVIAGNVKDVHYYLVLAMDLASIRLNVMVTGWQQSDFKLTLWLTLGIPIVR